MPTTSHPAELRLVPVPGAPTPSAEDPGQAVVHVVDTLADAVRLAPLADALRRRVAVRQTLVHTGAEHDSLVADRDLAVLGLPRRRRALALPWAGHAERTAQALRAFEAVLVEERPTVVVVAGDGDAALACTLTAARLAVPALHLEAGLRAGDWSVPEEVNRVLADRLSDTLLVDGTEACRNLLVEGLDEGRIHDIGNPMVDALERCRARARSRAAWSAAAVREGAYVLVVLEHPHNVDDEDRMAATALALGRVAREAPVLYAVSQRHEPRLRREGWRERLAAHGVACVGPLGYVDLLSLKLGAGAVVTDVGLVQEEASALGVPCFTLRATTERLRTLTHGTNTLLGDDPAEVAVVRPGRSAPAAAAIPLWDGRAAQRAADVLVSQYLLADGLRAAG
jgi:UDP-N-acetylglucosamine 2-epimerase (non-hydrolysing)